MLFSCQSRSDFHDQSRRPLLGAPHLNHCVAWIVEPATMHDMPRVLIPKSPREAHNLTEQEIHDFYQGEISPALKELSDTKHLYQTVQFDDSLLMDEIQNAKG